MFLKSIELENDTPNERNIIIEWIIYTFFNLSETYLSILRENEDSDISIEKIAIDIKAESACQKALELYFDENTHLELPDTYTKNLITHREKELSEEEKLYTETFDNTNWDSLKKIFEDLVKEVMDYSQEDLQILNYILIEYIDQKSLLDKDLFSTFQSRLEKGDIHLNSENIQNFFFSSIVYNFFKALRFELNLEIMDNFTSVIYDRYFESKGDI